VFACAHPSPSTSYLHASVLRSTGVNSDASWIHLAGLVPLTALRVAFPEGPACSSMHEYEAMSRGHASLSVAPLTNLIRLALPGVPIMALVLSVGALGAALQELDLSCSGAFVTPELIIQVRPHPPARDEVVYPMPLPLMLASRRSATNSPVWWPCPSKTAAITGPRARLSCSPETL